MERHVHIGRQISEVLSQNISGKGWLRKSPRKSNVPSFPGPDRIQFSKLLLQTNSHLTSLRARRVLSDLGG